MRDSPPVKIYLAIEIQTPKQKQTITKEFVIKQIEERLAKSFDPFPNTIFDSSFRVSDVKEQEIPRNQAHFAYERA